MVDRFLDWVTQLPELAVYIVLMALSALENIFPPVPADVAVVLGGFLAQRGLTSAPVLGVACWLANTTSAAAMYFYARRRGPRFFESGWRRKLMPPEAIAAIQTAYERHGVLGIFLSRFLPGVRAAVTPFAGDRGFLVPELTAAATAREAGEVLDVAGGAGLYSTCRTCEIGMSRAVGRPYRSLVHLVHEALAGA